MASRGRWKLLVCTVILSGFALGGRGPDASERSRRYQRPPNPAPVFLGNADGLHGSSSGKGRRSLLLECNENNERRQRPPLGFLRLEGGGILAARDSFTVSGPFSCSGGTLRGPGGTVAANGGTSIDSGLTVDGVTLANAATATWTSGNITVQNGGVLQNATGAIFGSAGNSNSVLLNNGTLAGSGTVNANVSNNGQVAPAAGVGSLVLNGNYGQGSSGTLSIGLAGTAAGTGYSQLVVNGGVTLGGSVAVSLTFLSAVGDQFAILHDGGSAGISGTFAGLSLCGLSSLVAA
jgi:hypothetical protein